MASVKLTELMKERSSISVSLNQNISLLHTEPEAAM